MSLRMKAGVHCSLLIVHSSLFMVLCSLFCVLCSVVLNAAPCQRGDLNADCIVNSADLRILAEHWLAPTGSVGDIDGIGGVNTVDLALLAQDWLSSLRPYTLVINELMADNNASVRDPHGDYDDWIEIYNYGDYPIDIGGMYLTDDLATPKKWQVPRTDPSATTVGAHGYLLIWADDQAAQGPLHAAFKLSLAGEDVGLYSPDGRLVDSIIFGPQTTDKSYGRFPDGSPLVADWQVFDTPTPGRPNQTAATKVTITEIMYHPYHPVPGVENIGEEYIELFNAGSAAADLTGYRLSDGVDFTFPNVVIDVGQYLVVAADVNTFTQKYPAVKNVIGGWVGWLSNSGERIELVDGAGIVIDSIHYSDQGDWAVRELGPADHNHRGWQWSDQTDGAGKSLELVNLAMPNEYGQNWAASKAAGGTPGRINSVAAGDIAPLILDVAHSPVIPRPNDKVIVTARVIDEQATGVSVVLHYRLDGQANFLTSPMFDDSAHGDAVANNAVYGAEIPPQTNRAIVEFYVEAVDAGGKARTWPAPSTVDGAAQQVTNLLYQVDQTFDPAAQWVAGSRPIYYFVMTEKERAELALIGSRSNGEEDSDAMMNGTFISIDGTGTELRYNVGIRNRGHGTRTGPPNNYHVSFLHTHLWRGVGAVNFNCRYTHAQIIGSVLFHMAGTAAADTTPAQLRINGANLASAGSPMFGVYVRLEAFSDDFAKNHFPDDPDGNLYTCFRDAGEAQLLYQGANPNTYRNSYLKANNEAQDDFSDLIHMLDVLNNAPDATYLQDVGKVINVPQWLHYIAIDSLLLNYETGLNMGIGDDYFLYCGVVDPRFVLIPHDLDTILDQGNAHGNINQSIFSIVNGVAGYNGVDGLKRFFSRPDVIPLYYQAILDNINEFFNPQTLDPLFDQVLGGFAPQDRINAMKQFVIQRTAAVLAQIPQKLTITSSLTQVNGYPRTSSPVSALSGTANAAKTRSVLVNGRPASWTPLDAKWSISAIALNPGINRIIVQTFDGLNGAGSQFEQGYIDIWYEDGGVSQISGTLAANRVLDAASGPWNVASDLTVPAGVTLTIQAGTTLFFAPGARLIVNGRLDAQGTAYQRIRFTKNPGSGSWAGFEFLNTKQDNRIAYADMEYCDSGSCAIQADHARVDMDNIIWGNHTKQYLIFDDSSVILKNSVLPSISNAELIHYLGFPSDGYALFEGNWFGATTGSNDIIDFTGGQRPGPIARFINNVFTGGSDDCIDLDGADAHVEGNVFMHVHMDAPRESKSHAVTTGTENGQVSELTVIRNLFYDVDYAFLSKDGGFITAVNNTVVHATAAAVNMYEQRSGQWQGAGFYGDGNIFYDVAHLFENPDWTGHPTSITMNNSIFPVIDGDPVVWTGSGNLDEDPQLLNTTNVTDPRIDFALRPTSPAIGTGPNGQDMGGLVPAGASISGEPGPRTWKTSATLTVGGPDIFGYKYRVNNGPWSAEILRPDPNLPGVPVQPLLPIELTNLTDGAYTAHVIMKNSASVWQDESQAVASRTWTVDKSYSRLVINEVLATNTTFAHEGTLPDMIELYYDGPASLNLSGMRITDDPNNPTRFVFPAGVTIATGQYLVLFADANTATSGIHTGFALDHEGDSVYLYDKNGALIDSVVFGLQLPDLSIGRVGYEGNWHLTKPTFGSENIARSLGNPDTLKINEWFTDGLVLFEDDFIELYNPHTNPVDLGGMYLTDNPVTQPARHKIAPLSFVPGNGYAIFWADDSTDPGHMDFRLSPDLGMIGVFDGQLRQIDTVIYGPQTTDISQGRSPDGADTRGFLLLPTPGVANPAANKVITTTVALVEERANKRVLVPTASISDDWRGAVAFNDSSWLLCTGGAGGVGFDTDTAYKALITLDTQALMSGTGKNNTCYIRIPFTVDADSLSNVTKLMLKVRFDDGFVAYLNGKEIDRRNFTGTPSWNSRADSAVEASVADFDELFDVSQYIGDLKAGASILAVHGMNSSATSSDFLISVVLDAVFVKDEGGPVFENELNLLNGLRVTELMYNAPAGGNFDYIELQNISDVTLDLTSVRFTGGIDFVFPQMTLAPGQYVVVAANLTAFRSKYGTTVNVAGAYLGGLNNAGEKIVLNLPLPLEAAVLRFSYDYRWYPTTNGGGDSLVITDHLAPPDTWNQSQSWHAAAPSPGKP